MCSKIITDCRCAAYAGNSAGTIRVRFAETHVSRSSSSAIARSATADPPYWRGYLILPFPLKVHTENYIIIGIRCPPQTGCNDMAVSIHYLIDRPRSGWQKVAPGEQIGRA